MAYSGEQWPRNTRSMGKQKTSKRSNCQVDEEGQDDATDGGGHLSASSIIVIADALLLCIQELMSNSRLHVLS